MATSGASCDDARTPTASAANIIDAEFFGAKGYAVARGLLGPEELARLEADADRCAPDQRLRAQYNQTDDPHRYEYMLISSEAAKDGDGRGITSTEDATAAVACPPSRPGPVIESIVRALSQHMERSESFCIVSEPGARDQPLHTDSIPVEGGEMDEEEWQATLHYIGVLTPLVDTGPVCGQTGVVVGSHLRPILADEGLFMRPDGDLEHEVRVSLRRGDCLFMDGRTVHRGRRNRLGQEPEPPTASRNGKKTSAETKAKLAKRNSAATVGKRDQKCADSNLEARKHEEQQLSMPRRMLFFTFKLPNVRDGNAMAYTGEGPAAPAAGAQPSLKRPRTS